VREPVGGRAANAGQVDRRGGRLPLVGAQAVVGQTAFNPLIAWDLLRSGAWQGKGVLGPEAFPAKPFMDKMAEYGFPYGIMEM